MARATVDCTSEFSNVAQLVVVDSKDDSQRGENLQNFALELFRRWN
jgi:hypothetical protein